MESEEYAMNKLEEVIQKGLELNNAIEKLKHDTDVLNRVVYEKRCSKQEDILEELKKYEIIIRKLGIDTIYFPVNTCMFYYGLTRLMGIRLHTWNYQGKPVIQIDLGVFSTVQEGFYAKHSIGTVASGMINEKIMIGFVENWDRIRTIIDITFAEEVEKILLERKEKAIKNREVAIANLSAIK